MKELFKIDSKGKLRIWKIEAIGASLLEYAGLVDGKLVEHEKVCKAKNIGKSNETTPEEQALLEVESRYTDKLTKGYFKTKQEALTQEIFLPMLAKSFDTEKHKVDWDNCYAQIKYDGMRCIAIIKDNTVTLQSRDGKIITTVPHIAQSLEHLDNMVLDGELYNKDLGGFQQQMKAIKKHRDGITDLIKYNVYDTLLDKPFSARKDFLEKVELPDTCVKVQSTKIYNESELVGIHKQNIRQGYEGTIIRHGNDPYKINGRSSSLLKYKDFIDIALPVVDILPAEQRPEWGNPIFELNGETFGAGLRFSHEERVDLLNNKDQYIGKIGELRFFEYTDSGIPRHPILHGFRLDK